MEIRLASENEGPKRNESKKGRGTQEQKLDKQKYPAKNSKR